MRPIDRVLVDEVWEEMTAYPPEVIQSEALTFLDQQPHVVALAHRATQAFDAPVQQAALGLCFLLFKVLERSLGQPFPLVAEERIVAACERIEGWLAGTDGDAASVVAQMEPTEHPTLIAYILSVVYGEPANAEGYDERVRASLALLLATLSDALDLGEVQS
jgi:hypothetical protein